MLPLPGHLINKEVPTQITLETPFGAPIVTTLEGAYTKSFDPEFSAYYGTVKPLEFRLEVTANVKSERYTLKLSGKVRFCSKIQYLCVSDTLEVPYSLEIGNQKKPNLHAFALIGLMGEDALEGR